jgi:hypothetical protein
MYCISLTGPSYHEVGGTGCFVDCIVFYCQAPVTMKSVVQAAWLMTTAVGSLVVVIVAQVQYFTSQVRFKR